MLGDLSDELYLILCVGIEAVDADDRFYTALFDCFNVCDKVLASLLYQSEILLGVLFLCGEVYRKERI